MTPIQAAEATDAAWREHHGAVLDMLWRRTRSHHLAEDLAAETFIRLLRHLSVEDNEMPFHVRAWLYTVARNLFADHVKAPAAQRELLSHEPTGVRGDDVEASERHVPIETWQSALELLEVLPEHQRLVVILRGLKDLSIAETADHLGLSSQSVRYLRHAAKRRLAVERERFALGDSVLEPQTETAPPGTSLLTPRTRLSSPVVGRGGTGTEEDTSTEPRAAL